MDGSFSRTHLGFFLVFFVFFLSICFSSKPLLRLLLATVEATVCTKLVNRWKEGKEEWGGGGDQVQWKETVEVGRKRSRKNGTIRTSKWIFFWVSFKENAKNETNLVLFVDTEFFSSIFELKIFMWEVERIKEKQKRIKKKKKKMKGGLPFFYLIRWSISRGNENSSDWRWNHHGDWQLDTHGTRTRQHRKETPIIIMNICCFTIHLSREDRERNERVVEKKRLQYT